MALAEKLDIRTSDKTTPRGYFWIWYIRIFQTIITLVVFAIAAANIASLGNIDCSIPGKLGWQLACAILSFLVLLYFLFSTGPKPILKVLPWFLFLQLLLDAVMMVLWIAASATSRLNCNEQCGACGWPLWVDFDGLYCTCDVFDYTWWKRDASAKGSANPSAFAGGLEKRARRRSGGGGTRGAKAGLDALLVVLFFATLCAGIWFLWQQMQSRHRNNGVNPNPNNNNPAAGTSPNGGVVTYTQEPKHEESGVPTSTVPMQQPHQQQPPINQPNGYYPPQQPPQQPQQHGMNPSPPQPYAQAPQQQQQQYSESPSQPVNYYGGGSGPQASYPGPEPQGQQYGAYSEMGDTAPQRDMTVSPELHGGNTTGPAQPPPAAHQ